MKVLQLSNIWPMREKDDGSCENFLYGASILFGEEDVFEERYVKIVSLEDFGLTEEEAFDVDAGHLHGKKHLLDLEKLKSEAYRVVYKDIYPDFNPTRHTKFDKSSCDEPFFEKKPLILLFDEDDTVKYEDMKQNFLVELKATAILKQSRHPNVAAYLGCLVEHNRITGMYYERIPKSIHQIWRPLKVDTYISDIRNGIEHIHSLGLCHNDIHPENIRIRDDDTAVIIDFDACLPVGEKLHKWAPGRFGRDSRISKPENDWFGLEAVEQWMHEQNEKCLKASRTG